MKKSKGIATLLIMLVVVVAAVFGAAVIGMPTGIGADQNIKQGLDLAGGVSITYQAVDENPTDEAMNDTVYKLQKRVEVKNSEARVYREGDRRINVEIPGVSDANAILAELGKPGALEFVDPDGNVILTGADIASAQARTTEDSTTGAKKYIVTLDLTEEGTEAFREATTTYLGKVISIVYDGEHISDPVVNTVISDGSCYIEGQKTYEEAETLASQIRIGSLSLELEELHSKVVGAELGEEALSTSIKAAGIGILLIIIFMIAMYLIPGLAASIALVLYCALTILVLWFFDITLTLPGIAGVILSIGMAVDANVIIFARIREEIGVGKSVDSAIKAGFQKALSAIVDGNITTFIAAIVLGIRGSGPVKGFAYTLGIGIVLSMFTALVITRLLIKSFYAVGIKNPKLYGIQKERKLINFLGKKAVFFILSVAVIAAGFVGMGIRNGSNGTILNYSLDFVGGNSSTVTFGQDYSIEEISSTIVPVVEKITGDGNVQTQKIDGTNEVVIKTRSLSLEEREAFNAAMLENFGVEEGSILSENISSTISSEMKSDAVWAVVIATLCMLVYIWFRFKDIRFAGSAVIALIHDVLIVLAFYVFTWTSVGNTFIACMLTIVGYSINATIVIFDRIRENMAVARGQDKESLKEVVNSSITQTLSRSINTSLTTFIMVFVLWLLGVTTIREFAMPLMAGIICGAYSSVCITGALWFVFKVKFARKNK